MAISGKEATGGPLVARRRQSESGICHWWPLLDNRWSITGKQCSWWATRYQLDIGVVGHHWQLVALGGEPPVAHHYIAVWEVLHHKILGMGFLFWTKAPGTIFSADSIVGEEGLYQIIISPTVAILKLCYRDKFKIGQDVYLTTRVSFFRTIFLSV